MSREYNTGDLYYLEMDNKYFIVKYATAINVILMDVETGRIQTVAKSNFLDNVLKMVS